MKKLSLLLIIGVVMLLPSVVAQEEEVSAGIVPGTFLYNIDVFFDDMKISAAETPVEEAQLRLEVAEERAKEVEKLNAKGKSQFIGDATEQQRIQIEEVDKLTDNMDNDDHKKDIQERLLKHITTLERIQAEQPDNEGLQNALLKSTQAFQRGQIKIKKNNRVSEDSIKQKINNNEVHIRTNGGQ
jgi:hypothetical protein